MNREFNDDSDLLWEFTAFMDAVTRSARVDYLRRQKKWGREIPVKEIPVTGDTGYTDSLPPEAADGGFDFDEPWMSEVYSRLNTMRQRVLSLIFVEGLSARETADMLGCSIDFVYQHKHRALKKFRDYFIGGRI